MVRRGRRSGSASRPAPPRRRRRVGLANTRSTSSSTGRVERNDTSSRASRQGLPAACTRVAQQLVRAVELVDVGALERIDRLLAVADGEHRALGRRARLRRRRTPRSARARCATAPARCPAPRPAAGDRGRRPACTAPRPRPDRPAGWRCGRSGRRSRAGPMLPCARRRRRSTGAASVSSAAETAATLQRAGMRRSPRRCGRIPPGRRRADRDVRRAPPC